MKTNSKCCHQVAKVFYKKSPGNFKLLLILLFFVVSSTTGVLAQNSCFVTGDAARAPFPTAVIAANTNGSNLHYRANASASSTYSWVLSNNSSGASIVGSSTSQSVEVRPGSTAGSFTLTCTVAKIGSGDQNACVVSVAVFNPSAGGAPTSP